MPFSASGYCVINSSKLPASGHHALGVKKGFLLIPHWQAWMREKQPRLLLIWGRYDLSFELSDPEAYRRDVPKAEVHILGADHFALDTLQMRSTLISLARESHRPRVVRRTAWSSPRPTSTPRARRTLWRARFAGRRPLTANTTSAPDSGTQTGPTGTPSTWSPSRSARSCRNEHRIRRIVFVLFLSELNRDG